MEENRTCPVCGDAIIGRIDKKFCSDQCRNEFNNKQNQDANSYIRRINYTLRKNRRILEQLNPDGKIKISKAKLVNKGFDFRYFTNIYRTKTGNTYYFCYEHGYLPLENNFYALVRKDDYDPHTLATAAAESQQT
jgi:predicted nucleic acid-binding Zn ribbon protein